VTFEIPWPPSINKYYGRNKFGGVYLKKDAKQYLEYTPWLIKQKYPKTKIFGAVKILRDLYPPDNRRRDEDNIVKAINDSIMKAGIIKDDSQIMKAVNVKHQPKPPGCVKITLEEI